MPCQCSLGILLLSCSPSQRRDRHDHGRGRARAGPGRPRQRSWASGPGLTGPHSLELSFQAPQPEPTGSQTLAQVDSTPACTADSTTAIGRSLTRPGRAGEPDARIIRVIKPARTSATPTSPPSSARSESTRCPHSRGLHCIQEGDSFLVSPLQRNAWIRFGSEALFW